MRRTFSLLGVAALAVAASCGDNSTAPATVPAATGPAASADRGRSNVQKVEFNISPRGGEYTVGPYVLIFPDHSVCDPRTSGYGPDYWNVPCATLDRPFHIQATVGTVNGRSYVDFGPDIRFSPDKWVTIHTYRAALRGATGPLGRFAIWFADAPDAQVSDEALTDPTLITHLNLQTGWSWRRIKHFTGYQVLSGLVTDCTPYVDPDCLPLGSVTTDGFQ
ncbi:MAG TPA: hypothetical protein VG818_01300 [Gemmatimonadaceae bacterium]|nr:hypothetical protein [Gemmatimonadaceae bacterium]